MSRDAFPPRARATIAPGANIMARGTRFVVQRVYLFAASQCATRSIVQLLRQRRCRCRVVFPGRFRRLWLFFFSFFSNFFLQPAMAVSFFFDAFKLADSRHEPRGLARSLSSVLLQLYRSLGQAAGSSKFADCAGSPLPLPRPQVVPSTLPVSIVDRMQMGETSVSLLACRSPISFDRANV